MVKADVYQGMKLVKECLYTIRKDCMESLYTSKYPVLRTYVPFKVEFKLEKYLLYIKDFKIIIYSAKIRLSSLDLMIDLMLNQTDSKKGDCVI